MGMLIRCKFCGYETSVGYPGRGMEHHARQLLFTELNGKQISDEEFREKKTKILKKLITDHEKAQKKRDKENKVCPKSKNGHEFVQYAHID